MNQYVCYTRGKEGYCCRHNLLNNYGGHIQRGCDIERRKERCVIVGVFYSTPLDLYL